MLPFKYSFLWPGGSSSGSCASGFGVCCVCKSFHCMQFYWNLLLTYPWRVTTRQLVLTVSLSCGGSASENCTYLVQSSVTTLTSPCTYKVCPCNTNICRLRFDFQVRDFSFLGIRLFRSRIWQIGALLDLCPNVLLTACACLGDWPYFTRPNSIWT